MSLKKVAYIGGIVFFLSFIISSLFFSCTPSVAVNLKNNQFKMNSYSDYSPFPNKNFVFLEKYTTLDEEGNLCYGNPSTCTKKGDLIASASGAVIKKVGSTAYVLTAGHFCVNDSEGVPKKDGKDVVRAYAVYIQNFLIPARVIKIDELNDLCLISVKDPSIKRMSFKRIKVARSQPHVGEKIYTVAAPLGIYSPMSRHHFTGFYSGCEDYFNLKLIFCFYTIPAAEGSSGSLVLNKNGQIVGMIQLALIGFENISMGIHQDQIRLFLKDAADELNIIF